MSGGLRDLEEESDEEYDEEEDSEEEQETKTKQTRYHRPLIFGHHPLLIPENPEYLEYPENPKNPKYPSLFWFSGY